MIDERETAPKGERVLDRVPAWGWIVVALVVALGAFRLGLGLDPERTPVAAAADGSGVRGSLRDYRVQLASGDTVDLAPAGEPAVVMVSSVTCPFCAEAMGDFARMAAGRPLPRLRVVTLEGAVRGEPMLARRGLDGIWHAGPLDGAGQTLLTFQFPGTPTFLLLDAEGGVRAALSGYPGREAIQPWFRVMLGERETL
ncbi:MAG TPA: hypothetical protein VGE02_04630 [Gemmatimonadales bacterium]